MVYFTNPWYIWNRLALGLASTRPPPFRYSHTWTFEDFLYLDTFNHTLIYIVLVYYKCNYQQLIIVLIVLMQ